MRRFALMLVIALMLATAAVAWAVAPTGIPVAPSPAPTITGVATPGPSPVTSSVRPEPTRAPPTPTATPTATPSPTPTAAPTPSPPPATPPPFPTDAPDSHTAPDLEARLPSEVDGIALHRTSPSIAGQLEADPRAANALRLLRLTGRSARDIRFARAEDRTNPARLTILAFQIRGIPASVFGRAIVNTVVSELPGTQTSTITLAGRSVTRATPPSGESSAYVYEVGDTVFAIQTGDERLAAGAVAQLP